VSDSGANSVVIVFGAVALLGLAGAGMRRAAFVQG